MTRGCVHNVKEVDMMQRRRRRREPTTSIQSNVRGRDVDGVSPLEEIEIRLHGQPS
jgi:hypothetical protein